jgi:gliding motility-associated-like protein
MKKLFFLSLLLNIFCFIKPKKLSIILIVLFNFISTDSIGQARYDWCIIDPYILFTDVDNDGAYDENIDIVTSDSRTIYKDSISPSSIFRRITASQGTGYIPTQIVGTTIYFVVDSISIFQIFLRTDTIVYHDIPKVNFYANGILIPGISKKICEGDSIEITASLSNTTSYHWVINNIDTISFDSTIVIKDAGIYKIELENDYCTSYKNIILQHYQLPKTQFTIQGTPVVDDEVSLCSSELPITIEAIETQVGISIDSYNWTFENTPTSNSSSQTINKEGYYSVKSTSSKACISNDTVLVKVNPNPIQPMVDTILCTNNPIYIKDIYPLHANFNTTVFDTIDATNNILLNTYMDLLNEINYINIHIKDPITGCENNGILTIKEKCSNLELPNIFSPNGDNLNDKFTPIIMKAINTFDFKVYNRWGNLLHESTSLLEWNGTNKNGKKSPPGTYFFILKYSDMDNKPYIKKSSISLLR